MEEYKIRDERYPLLGSVSTEALTPMMRQYLQMKAQYLDYLLFYRLGDFYELFFDDAVKASEVLEIALTSRGSVGDMKIPMCGVPFHALDTYLKRAVGHSLRIAICEQEEPEGKGIVRRNVVRLITPGTIYSSELLESDQSNYLASVRKEEGHLFSLAFCEISTGERKKTSVNGADLRNELKKWNPAEILFFSDNIDPDSVAGFGVMTDLCRIPEIAGSIPELPIDPEQMLDAYVRYTAKRDLGHFSEMREYDMRSNMILDSGSIRNLELIETMHGKKKKGSLLGVLDVTRTAMGARLLRETLKSPLFDVDAIRKRHDFVAYFYKNYWERSNMRSLLSQIYDLERIVTKLVYDTVSYKDLVCVKQSLQAIREIRKSRPAESAHFFEELQPPEELITLIDEAIEETGQEMRSGFSVELDEVRSFLKGGKKWILELEAREKERTGIRTLRVNYNKVYGYYIEVSRSFADKVPEDYIRRQTLVNSERYVTEELKRLEENVLTAAEKASNIEQSLFRSLKDRVRKEIPALQADAKRIAEIDMLTAFAEVSYIRGYVQPTVDASSALEIEGGRHPVIETLGEYIANDTKMGAEQTIFILTGPNMAGKSSYLRQNALIIIMAQMGCFVPAKRARIGIVDRVFTRVGASDDLAEGRSTFMVEMKELAEILDHLSPRSFVILDEIGRGTSTFDGLSIALSVVEYLSGHQAKVMFATHYHELTALEGKLPGVLNYRIEVKKSGEDIIFLRTIVRGSENRSYGIEVAHLAGVKEEVVRRARQILRQLDQGETRFIGENLYREDLQDHLQEDLYREFPPEEAIESECAAEECTAETEWRQRILTFFRDLDMDALSPRQAWEILSDLKENIPS